MIILLINQLYLEPQKPFSHYSYPKKLKEGFLIKKKIQKLCRVKKGKADAMVKFQQQQSLRISQQESQFSFAQEKLLRVMYLIESIFAEETESSEEPNVTRASSGVILALY